MSVAFIGLGSNMGERQANLEQALTLLREAGATVTAVSAWRETKPYGVLDQPDFLNGVVEIIWQGTAQELLLACQHIEQQMGRVRKRHWGERNIDLDILFFDQQIINTPTLVVPHPDIANRQFVLEPLNELAPNLLHPVLQKTIRELYEKL